MAPGVNGDLVYVSTVPGNPDGFYTGNGQGILHALNAETGEKVWQFDTVPADLWGNKEINSGGGLWHPPAFDDQGDAYIDIANPAPFLGTKEFPWGTSRPGNEPEHTNTSSSSTRRRARCSWKNQVLPHDIYDWDLHLPPVLADTADGQQLVHQRRQDGLRLRHRPRERQAALEDGRRQAQRPRRRQRARARRQDRASCRSCR